MCLGTMFGGGKGLMEDYKLIEVLSPELVVLGSDDYGTQMWGVCNLTKKHSGDECVMCGGLVGKKAYRPATNKYNRGSRICIRCVEGLKCVKERKTETDVKNG